MVYSLYNLNWYCFFQRRKTWENCSNRINLLIVVTDQTGYRILKELFGRVRPCNVLTDVITPIGCAGGFSFPSNHALNNFAAAVFLLRIFPAYKWIFLIVAFLISVSRIYLGVHYPSDVLGGAILGIGFGYLFSLVVLLFLNYLEKKKNEKKLSG